jgi:hypothetical protein
MVFMFGAMSTMSVIEPCMVNAELQTEFPSGSVPAIFLALSI